MLARIKNLLHNYAIYFAVLTTVSIGILSLIKMPQEGIPIESSDKFLHTVAYFFLMLTWLYSYSRKEDFYKRIKFLILGCLIYGIVLEALQGAFTSYRTGSYLDILANSLGIVLAVLAFHLFEKKIRFN
jgi:VanZ family protein